MSICKVKREVSVSSFVKSLTNDLQESSSLSCVGFGPRSNSGIIDQEEDLKDGISTLMVEKSVGPIFRTTET